MPPKDRPQLVAAYVKNIRQTHNERAKKERFIALLTQLFGHMDEFGIIDQFTCGAEHQITEIRREGKRSDRGRADTQYGSVIIEFEHDLSRTGDHAVEQLKEYLSGNWNRGVACGFTLIASDCLTWRIYTPEYGSLIRLGNIRAEDITLELVEEFAVSPDKPDEFFFFLDRFLFYSTPLPATLEAIRKGFGHGSTVLQTCMHTLHAHYAGIHDTPTMRTAYEQWHKFLSVAYGSFDASERVFLTHSYLSILAKMLAYTVLASKEYLGDEDAREILSGDAFKRFNVSNFTSDDFFQWTAEKNRHNALKPVFRAIAKELSLYDFKHIREDILKGVYQELVDADSRHSLGEYYTPDWLCGHIVETLNPKPGQKVLDPACGSGSFLKAVANHLKNKKPDITARELNDSLYGIDIHPLSVQIAKATVLTALGERVQRERQPLDLHIYLANTLLLPHEGGAQEQFTTIGNYYHITLANQTIRVHESVFKDEQQYDNLVLTCNGSVEQDMRVGKTREQMQISASFIQRLGTREPLLLEGAFFIYKVLSEAKLQGRDSIWAYILQNSYRPFFLREKFDVIVGNPPWLKFANVDNGQYQSDLKALSSTYSVKPNPANMPHLELAVLFLAHACNYFMKPTGSLAFVMPRSLFSAEQHHNTRAGKTKLVKITEIWDLHDVSPLFNVPSCVLFAKRHRNAGTPAPKRIEGRRMSGRLPGHNLNRQTADSHLTTEAGPFHLSKLGNTTAWTLKEHTQLGGNNPYRGEFRQGATIVPRSCYFVTIDQPYQGSLHDRILRIRTSEAAVREAKKPWTDIRLTEGMPTRFLFRTALSNNVVPFALNGTRLVVLPIQVERNKIRLQTVEQLESRGEIEAARWFADVAGLWNERKTERNIETTHLNYLNWMNKLTEQALQSRYAVLYISSGTNICSVVVDREDIRDVPFVVDYTTYVSFLDNKEHAYYLNAFLNADFPNKLIKPFQPQGLQGPRHICKKILEVPLPRFDSDNPLHRALSEAAQTAADKAKTFLAAQNLGEDGGCLSTHKIGRLRSEIRRHVAEELAEIDRILQKLLAVN